MITAWLLLLVPLSMQTLVPPLTPTWPLQHISSPSTLTGDELLRIGEIHDAQHHFYESLTYYQLALSRFREKKQRLGVANTLLKIAQVYERQGKFRDAADALQEALPLLERSADRAAHARALLVWGRVSARLGQSDEARTSLSQAVALFQRTKDRRGWNESLVQLGLFHVSDGVTEPGLSLLQQAWQDARARRDRSQELVAVVALGNAQWFLDRTNEARRFYNEGLHLAETERDMATEAALRLRLASMAEEDGALIEGIDSGKRALFLFQTLRDPVAESATLALLADLYRKMERDVEAEEAEQRARSMYRNRQILVHGGR